MRWLTVPQAHSNHRLTDMIVATRRQACNGTACRVSPVSGCFAQPCGNCATILVVYQGLLLSRERRPESTKPKISIAHAPAK